MGLILTTYIHWDDPPSRDSRAPFFFGGETPPLEPGNIKFQPQFFFAEKFNAKIFGDFLVAVFFLVSQFFFAGVSDGFSNEN